MKKMRILSLAVTRFVTLVTGAVRSTAVPTRIYCTSTVAMTTSPPTAVTTGRVSVPSKKISERTV